MGISYQEFIEQLRSDNEYYNSLIISTNIGTSITSMLIKTKNTTDAKGLILYYKEASD